METQGGNDGALNNLGLTTMQAPEHGPARDILRALVA